jgi:glycosyltransferase involved in cell wall biosynthesis
MIIRGLAIMYRPHSLWAFSGSERRFINISKYLKNYNISFDIIEPYPPLNSILNTSYKSHVIKISNNVYINLIEWLFLGVMKIFKLNKKQYDFIYITNNNIYNLLLGILASRILALPSIVVVHHLRWIDYTNKHYANFNIKRTYMLMRKWGLNIIASLIRVLGAYIENILLKKVNLCIAVSNTVASQLNKLGCKNIYVTGNIINEDFKYQDSNKHIKKYDAIYIGRLDEGKGILDLLDVWNIVIQRLPEAKLIIIGKGFFYKKAKSIIKKKGLEKNIYLLGFVRDQELKSFIVSSKIFVTLSVIEGFGLAIGEALKYGLPVICYDIPTLREIYGNCNNVIFIRLGDKQKVANEIIKLLRESNLKVNNLPNIFHSNEVIKKEYDAIKSVLVKGKMI